MTATRKRAVLAAALIVAATLIGRAFTIIEPGQHDAQLYRLIGRVWLDGWIPYRDIWDNKPPGIYLLAAGITRTGMTWYGTVALLEAAAVLLTCAGVYAVLRELQLPSAMALIGTIVAALALNLDRLNEGGFTTELFVAPAATASVLFFLRARAHGRAHLVLAGCCAAIASLFKQPGAAVLLAQTTFVLGAIGFRWRSARPGDRAFYERPSTLLLLAAGAVLPWLITYSYFFAHGAARDMLEAIFGANLGNVAALQPALFDSLRRLVRVMLPVAPLALAAAALLWIAARAYNDKPTGASAPPALLWLILLWIACEVAGLMAGGRYYGHYLLQVVPSLAIATALVIHQLRDRTLRSLAVGCALLPLLAQVSIDGARLLSRREPPARSYAHEPAAAIRGMSAGRVDETLFTWDYLPALYIATGLKPPLRYANVPHLGATARRAAIADTVMAALRDRPPAFLVDAGAPRPLPGRDTLRFAAYESLLAAGYRLLVTDMLYGIRVFQRTDPPFQRR